MSLKICHTEVVGIVVLNKDNKVFVAKRIDNPKFLANASRGVDKDEDYLSAAYRESKRNCIKSVELISELDGLITYDLPDHLLGIIWKGRYKGQTQKWYLMRFTGNEEEINIKTKHPEFLEWKWVELDQITDLVVKFKLELYKEVKDKVKKILN